MNGVTPSPAAGAAAAGALAEQAERKFTLADGVAFAAAVGASALGESYRVFTQYAGPAMPPELRERIERSLISTRTPYELALIINYHVSDHFVNREHAEKHRSALLSQSYRVQFEAYARRNIQFTPGKEELIIHDTHKIFNFTGFQMAIKNNGPNAKVDEIQFPTLGVRVEIERMGHRDRRPVYIAFVNPEMYHTDAQGDHWVVYKLNLDVLPDTVFPTIRWSRCHGTVGPVMPHFDSSFQVEDVLQTELPSLTAQPGRSDISTRILGLTADEADSIIDNFQVYESDSVPRMQLMRLNVSRLAQDRLCSSPFPYGLAAYLYRLSQAFDVNSNLILFREHENDPYPQVLQGSNPPQKAGRVFLFPFMQTRRHNAMAAWQTSNALASRVFIEKPYEDDWDNAVAFTDTHAVIGHTEDLVSQFAELKEAAARQVEQKRRAALPPTNSTPSLAQRLGSFFGGLFTRAPVSVPAAVAVNQSERKAEAAVVRKPMRQFTLARVTHVEKRVRLLAQIAQGHIRPFWQGDTLRGSGDAVVLAEHAGGSTLVSWNQTGYNSIVESVSSTKQDVIKTAEAPNALQQGSELPLRISRHIPGYHGLHLPLGMDGSARASLYQERVEEVRYVRRLWPMPRKTPYSSPCEELVRRVRELTPILFSALKEVSATPVPKELCGIIAEHAVNFHFLQ